MSLTKLLRLEWHIAWRSKWTLALLVLLILTLVYSSVTSYQFAKTSQRTLQRIENIQGKNFKNWVVESKEAEFVKQDLWGIHPVTGTNVFLMVLAAVAPMFAILWGASSIGNEFGWGTVKIRAAHYGWSKTVMSKMILIIAMSIAIVFLVSLIGSIANRITWYFAIHSIKIAGWIKPPVLHVSFFKQVLVLILGLSFYGLLGAFLALITRSTAAGIVIGLSVPFVEKFATKWWLPQSSYGYLLTKQIVYFSGGIVAPPSVPSPPALLYSWLTLIFWICLLTAAFWFFPRKQEIS